MKQRCPKCGEKADVLYSPGWVCKDFVPKEIKAMYPLWDRSKKETRK